MKKFFESLWSRLASSRFLGGLGRATSDADEAGDLNTAIVLYVGHGAYSHPETSSERVVERFGSMYGALLSARVDGLLLEMDGLKTPWGKYDLNEGTKWASDQMRRRHPELREEAIAALGWSYSYWNK